MIDFINVKKTNKSGVEALKGVDFTIEDGEFVFIIGNQDRANQHFLSVLHVKRRPLPVK